MTASGLARELEPAAAERTRFFVVARGPLALYGFEAMALILDAVGPSGHDRAAILRALRTTTEYGRMAVVESQLVWDLTRPTP